MGLSPGERPERYWNPLLGHFANLRPSDIGELTAEQLVAAQRFANQAAGIRPVRSVG